MKIAIIGGGVCGCVSGIFLLKKGFEVTIFEKEEKLLKKLSITGNGRCNITNENISIDNYYSNNITFFENFFKEFDTNKIYKIFDELGILTTKLRNSKRIFPQSFQAKSIVKIFLLWLEKLNANIILNKTINNIKIEDNRYFIDKKHFDKIIIATGSCAKKQVGGSLVAYDIVKNLNITLTDVYPSLVQINSKEKFIKELVGVRVEVNISLFIDNTHILNSSGEILFTKYGVSGDVILNISRYVCQSKSNNIYIKVDLLPNISKEKLLSILKKQNLLEKNLLLSSLLNEKLIPVLIKKYRYINQKNIKSIIYDIKNFKIKLDSCRGFDYAEVVNGGVSINEIKKNFESKKYKNIFFCGEVLDIDGDCGGYNLHFAISSGYYLSKII